MNILEWLGDKNTLQKTLLNFQAHEIHMTYNHLLHTILFEETCLLATVAELVNRNLVVSSSQGRVTDVVYVHNCCQFFK